MVVYALKIIVDLLLQWTVKREESYKVQEIFCNVLLQSSYVEQNVQVLC